MLVGARHRAEDDAAPRPLRRPRRPLAGAAGTLLPPGLDASSGDGRAVLGAVDPAAARRELAADLGVEEVLPDGHLEDARREVQGPRLAVLQRHYVQGRHLPRPTPLRA